MRGEGRRIFLWSRGEVQSEALHPDTAPPCPAWGAVTLNRPQDSRKPTQARAREVLAAVCVSGPAAAQPRHKKIMRPPSWPVTGTTRGLGPGRRPSWTPGAHDPGRRGVGPCPPAPRLAGWPSPHMAKEPRQGPRVAGTGRDRAPGPAGTGLPTRAAGGHGLGLRGALQSGRGDLKALLLPREQWASLREGPRPRAGNV